jgi:hypothetical protein
VLRTEQRTYIAEVGYIIFRRLGLWVSPPAAPYFHIKWRKHGKMHMPELVGLAHTAAGVSAFSFQLTVLTICWVRIYGTSSYVVFRSKLSFESQGIIIRGFNTARLPKLALLYNSISNAQNMNNIKRCSQFRWFWNNDVNPQLQHWGAFVIVTNVYVHNSVVWRNKVVNDRSSGILSQTTKPKSQNIYSFEIIVPSPP